MTKKPRRRYSDEFKAEAGLQHAVVDTALIFATRRRVGVLLDA